ncbi:hypothetical protein HNY73_008750 [Argiope bruennichi]|uniref:Uncharacterized protein n=1 Tax=Argiope bruennichi TaxID=94029 RepID=A0A8T0F9Q4_ARGBR|nr:hypothetical protein HNY73_008750 [Argiope bruennichi]
MVNASRQQFHPLLLSLQDADYRNFIVSPSEERMLYNTLEIHLKEFPNTSNASTSKSYELQSYNGRIKGLITEDNRGHFPIHRNREVLGLLTSLENMNYENFELDGPQLFTLYGILNDPDLEDHTPYRDEYCPENGISELSEGCCYRYLWSYKRQ